MQAPTIKVQVTELATRLYVDLVMRSIVIEGNAVSLPASAQSLARLSFKLADTFQRVEDELNAESLPKNQDFKVDVASIEAWTTK